MKLGSQHQGAEPVERIFYLLNPRTSAIVVAWGGWGRHEKARGRHNAAQGDIFRHRRRDKLAQGGSRRSSAAENCVLWSLEADGRLASDERATSVVEEGG